MSQTRRIRNPSRYYSTIGKNATRVLDYVHAVGGVVSLEEIADQLGIRKNNLKSRYISRLLEFELLEVADGGYVTPADIEAKLERYLEASGMALTERYQVKQYELQREAWHTGNGRGPTPREVKLARELERIQGMRQATNQEIAV